MENEILRNVLLIVSIIAVFALGFFIMKRLDAYFDKNYNRYFKQDEKSARIMHNEDSTDEERLSNIKKMRVKSAKTGTVVSDEKIDDDE